MTENKAVMQQELQTVGYYGLNHNGYEVIDLKESHVLRMFDADEITAQPVCLLSDAMDIIHALRAAIAQTERPTAADFYQFQTPNGAWHFFSDKEHYENTVADGKWPIRSLYVTPSAAQPEQPGLAERIQREIDHCVMNDTRLVPNLGRMKGDLAVRAAYLEAILETIAQPEQTAPGLSLNLLERLSKTLTRLGYATPEGGMEHFNADLANQLYSLCQAVDNIFDRAQPEQKAEQNFCARCGKRLAGDGIHTCTPPKAKQ